MKTPHSVRRRAKSARRTGTRMPKLVGVAAALLMAIVWLAAGTPMAASNAAGDQAKEKRYKATRAFVVDKQSGAVRMPTQEEVDEVVANLSSLGQKPTENLQQTSTATGAVTVDLAGGFGGVLLARPNEDGTWETKCVFTLEEGAEFLGLVEDNSAR
jgi:uncharacterized membrane protein